MSKRHPFDEPVYEPVKRNKDGLRWISHRFPIKGGISARELLARNLTEPNPLLEILRMDNLH